MIAQFKVIFFGAIATIFLCTGYVLFSDPLSFSPSTPAPPLSFLPPSGNIKRYVQPNQLLDTGDDKQILKYFVHDNNPADIAVDKAAFATHSTTVVCNDGTTHFTNITQWGRPFRKGRYTRCTAVVKNAICKTGVFTNTKLVNEISTVYPYFNQTTITYEDVKMAKLFLQYDKLKQNFSFYEPNATDSSNVRIAFLLMVHHSQAKVKRLIDYLNHPNHKIFIHVDRVATGEFEAIREYAQTFPNVVILSNFQGAHSGISLLYIEMSALLGILLDEFPWDYVVNLSESDYTFLPLDQLRENVARLQRGSMLGHYFDNVSYQARILKYHVECWGGPTRVSNATLMDRPFMERVGNFNINFEVKGSQWHVLHRDYVKWVAEDDVPRQLLFYLKNSLIPDEIYSAVLAKFLLTYKKVFNIKVLNAWSHRTAWDEQNFAVSCGYLKYLAKTNDHSLLFVRKFTNDEAFECAHQIRLEMQSTRT